jgi:hypothetical protein
VTEDQPVDRVGGSFRDPSGYVFTHDGVVHRRVNDVYAAHYDRLLGSGLADDLFQRGLLIRHEEVRPSDLGQHSAYRVLRPDRIPFISYPYEWSFSQLKDAALLTLKIQARALKAGMSLKDASAFNVQFLRGKPVFIDTLSFEVAPVERPWVAYRQFCQHFLAPLALMSYRDVRLSQLSRLYMDGVPLDLASTLLPKRTRLLPQLAMHLHLHARAQKKYAGKRGKVPHRRMSQAAQLGVLESLAQTVRKLTWRPSGTEWADYYTDTNYSEQSMADKVRLVSEMLAASRPQLVWDLGANVGRFSRLASAMKVDAIAFDVDPAAVERNYLDVVAAGEPHLLPLVADLTNPSGPIGWANEERLSLQQRGPADLVLALALIHHLAVGNNVPLPAAAAWFARLARTVVIEFVPKADSQVQRMLASRTDIFGTYTQERFEAAFQRHFAITRRAPIAGTERVLYHLTRN